MKNNFNKFLYLVPILLIGLSIFLSNSTKAQDAYWPWVELAYGTPNYVSNVASNSATFNAVLSFANAQDARNVSTKVWFIYYKWYGDYNTTKYTTSEQVINYNGGQQYPRFPFSLNVNGLEPNTNYCIQAKAQNSAGTNESTALCFTTLASGTGGSGTGGSGTGGSSTTNNLLIITKGTNGYGTTWANLQGEVNKMTGISKVDYYFLYKKDGDSTYKATGIYQRTNTGLFDVQVNDLIANSRYCFKAIGRDANNFSVISNGAEICFTTQNSGSGGSGTGGSSTNNNLLAETRNLNDYGSNWATFKGDIVKMDGISRVSYYFTYRKDGSSSQQATGIYTTTATGPIQIQVNNLDTNSRYCYRVVAKDYNNASVYSEGSEICFNTNNSGSGNSGSGSSNNNYGLNVDTLSYDNVSNNYAMLMGDLTNMGNSSRVEYWFEYYKSNGGSVLTTNREIKSSIGQFSLGVYGLEQDTVYCYRAMVANYNNSNEWDRGNEYCFRTLRSNQTNNNNTINYPNYVGSSSRICYRGVMIYIDYDSSGNQIVSTKGLTGNNNTVQRFSSEQSAKNYINSLDYYQNQCTPNQGTSSGNQNKRRYYCQLSTGNCVQTNSEYQSLPACEYSVKTYLAGQTTNICFDTSSECSKYCKKGSGNYTPPVSPTQTSGSGSGVYTRNKYYYCRASDKTCVETDGTYATQDICSQSLNIYKPGISTGLCFDKDTCQKNCGGIASNNATTTIKEPIVVNPPCQKDETRLETLQATDILEKSMQFNGRLLCIADVNTVVGFEYYGKSESAMTVKQVYLTDYKITAGQLISVLEFKHVQKDMEPGTTYCYKAIAKLGTQMFYGNEICFPEDKRTVETCETVIDEYITEPFDMSEEAYEALNENCPTSIGSECLADKERGFMDKMIDYRDAYRKSKEKVLEQVKKAVDRGGLAKFFIGPNWGAIKAVEKYVKENETRIEDAKNLAKEYKSKCSEMAITRTIKLLQDENTQISENMEKAKKGFSLFGWLFKIFS